MKRSTKRYVAVCLVSLFASFSFLFYRGYLRDGLVLSSSRFATKEIGIVSRTGLFDPYTGPCADVMRRHNISMRKFVLGLSYWEQLTMATNNLCCLTAFSRHWQARTVSPFTRNAEMWGLPSTINYPVFHGMSTIYDAGPGKPISSLFNMTIFNSRMLCAQYDTPPLADFDDFMLKADRNIRLLHFSFGAYGEFLTEKDFRKSNHIDCLKFTKFRKFSKKLQNYLNNEASQKGLPFFTVVSACCVNHLYLTTPEEMLKQCGFHGLDTFTIIITTWRGYSDLPTKKFRLVVPLDSPVLRRPSSNYTAYPLNNDILSNVTAYHMKISEGKDFIAVHIRTAKLGMLDYTSWKRLSTKCFKLAWRLISELESNYKELPIKYFVDYGTYGSHSREIYHGKRVSRAPFGQKRITPIHYNPEEFRGWTDQGFVSLVEQSAIAKAKILVLLGGGSFQDEILTHFKQGGKGESAYSICSTPDTLTVTKVV